MEHLAFNRHSLFLVSGQQAWRFGGGMGLCGWKELPNFEQVSQVLYDNEARR